MLRNLGFEYLIKITGFAAAYDITIDDIWYKGGRGGGLRSLLKITPWIQHRREAETRALISPGLRPSNRAH